MFQKCDEYAHTRPSGLRIETLHGRSLESCVKAKPKARCATTTHDTHLNTDHGVYAVTLSDAAIAVCTERERGSFQLPCSHMDIHAWTR